jgi:hypothetical protein
MSETASQRLSADEALAFAHVRKLKGFYLHFAVYCIVISFLTILNLFTSPHYLWVIWVALGWGVGVLLHGLGVFEKFPFLNGEWERRQVEKYLRRKGLKETQIRTAQATSGLVRKRTEIAFSNAFLDQEYMRSGHLTGRWKL